MAKSNISQLVKFCQKEKVFVLSWTVQKNIILVHTVLILWKLYKYTSFFVKTLKEIVNHNAKTLLNIIEYWAALEPQTSFVFSVYFSIFLFIYCIYSPFFLGHYPFCTHSSNFWILFEYFFVLLSWGL